MLLDPIQGKESKRGLKSSVVTLPGPVAGWATMNSPLSDNLNTARILKNIVPRRTFGEARGGYRITGKIPGADATAETLMSYTDGSQTTLIVAGKGRIYEVPETPPASVDDPIPDATELATGFSNDRWISTMMADATDEMRLIMVNGEDDVVTYSPSEGVVKNTVMADASYVTSFKGRLWYVKSGTAELYYSEPLVNKPAVPPTPFFIGALLKEGGYIVALESLSLDGGIGPDDYLVAISNRGECIVFSGVDPNTDFSLVGNFDLQSPVGPRCLKKVGSDLMYYSTSGPEGLRKLLGGTGSLADYVTNTIQDEFENAFQLSGQSYGWTMVNYSAAGWVLFNVPITFPGRMDQFVFNLETGAWFRIEGWQALSWVEHNGAIYFSDGKGNVSIADYGGSDQGNFIPVDYMQNWNEYGTPNIKKFNNVKITLRSAHKPEPLMDMMVDYDEREPEGTTAFPREAVTSPWNTSPWNTSPWSSSPIFSVEVAGLSDMGYVGAFRYRENVKDSFLQIYGFQIIYEQGEIL